MDRIEAEVVLPEEELNYRLSPQEVQRISFIS
jgi:hypothetical protein